MNVLNGDRRGEGAVVEADGRGLGIKTNRGRGSVAARWRGNVVDALSGVNCKRTRAVADGAGEENWGWGSDQGWACSVGGAGGEQSWASRKQSRARAVGGRWAGEEDRARGAAAIAVRLRKAEEGGDEGESLEHFDTVFWLVTDSNC